MRYFTTKSAAIGLALALALSLCACSAVPSPEHAFAPPAVTVSPPTPTPAPTPTPWQPPTEEDILAQIAATDVLSHIPADTYQKEGALHAYELITADPQLAYGLPGRYAAWLGDVRSALLADPRAQSVTMDTTLPSWQLLSVLACSYMGQPDALSNALKSACEFDINILPDGETETYSLQITAAPKNPVDLFYSLDTAGEVTPLANLFSYAYLSTIYDDEMNIRDGIGTPPLPALLFPIENPARWYFDDTWYAGRDGGTRRHTGTDINAPEGTGLLACVDGVIFDAGSGGGAGNFVVVRGADGTQYHYYHMVAPTGLSVGDAVKAGDVVGRVGNTGNSAANHLHFTIITADGHYLNPYPYLLDAQDRAAGAGNR